MCSRPKVTNTNTTVQAPPEVAPPPPVTNAALMIPGQDDDNPVGIRALRTRTNSRLRIGGSRSRAGGTTGTMVAGAGVQTPGRSGAVSG